MTIDPVHIETIDTMNNIDTIATTDGTKTTPKCEIPDIIKLHHLGITGELWQLYRSRYDGMSSQVKWSNLISQTIL